VDFVMMVVRKRRGRRQTEIGFRKPDKNGQWRGGAREGAGRKPKVKGKRCPPHKARRDVDANHPQHITLRVLDSVPHLRTSDLYAAVKRALDACGVKDDFQIVHHSVMGNHIHLIVEALNKTALWQGVRAFEISAARHINNAVSERHEVRRRGQVFADRYHPVAIQSPKQMRAVIAYVLCNWRHHYGNRGRSLFDGKLDPFSSAIWFPGWAERTTPTIHIPPDYDPPPRCSPRTWLLNEGWKRGGGPISVWYVPK
jgi:REP element-mobilizing transposase RayT